MGAGDRSADPVEGPESPDDELDPETLKSRARWGVVILLGRTVVLHRPEPEPT